MLQQLCRMVAVALKHPVYGVNACLLEMRQLGYFGVSPFTDQPANLTDAVTPYESRSLADGDVYLETPFVVVSIDMPFLSEIQAPDWVSVFAQSDAISVAVRIVSGDADGELANRHADYLTRAVVWSMAKWFSEEHTADRVLQGIKAMSCQRLLYGPVEEKIGQATVTAAVVLTIRARDFAD